MPLTLLTPEPAELPVQNISALGSYIFEEVPEEVATALIEILNKFADESMSTDQFVDDMVSACDIHADVLFKLFTSLSITVDKKQHKIIVTRSIKKKKLIETASDILKNFAESLINHGNGVDQKRPVFTRKNASSDSWTTRAYTSEHCLSVNITAYANNVQPEDFEFSYKGQQFL